MELLETDAGVTQRYQNISFITNENATWECGWELWARGFAIKAVPKLKFPP